MIDISQSFELDDDPILIVGRRRKPKELEAFIVNLDSSTFVELRDIAMSTINVARRSTAVEWRPNLVIEEAQLAVVDSGYLPPALTAGAAEAVDEGLFDTDGLLGADLLDLLRSSGGLESLTPAILESGDFRFYAIIWPSGDSGRLVAFVSEFNPVAIRRQAKSFYSFDGTLELTAGPDFALDGIADLVVASEAIWILRAVAFDRLFADVRASLNDVEASVSALQSALPRVAFSSISLKAIRSVCAIKPTYARRLQDLSEAEHIKSITPALLKRALEDHGSDPLDFIRAGVVEIDRDEVGELLDVLEGRWYEADFSMEPRRAGRWTRRSSRPARDLAGADVES
jgi:hypothetical protein